MKIFLAIIKIFESVNSLFHLNSTTSINHAMFFSKYFLFFSKYLSILLILFSLFSCKNRDYNLNDSDNMTEISNIKEVYATGIPQRVREILNHYSNLDLSIKKNQKEVEDFKEIIYLFKEKFIITHLNFYKVYGRCGKDAYGMGIFINHKHLENLNILLSKTKNGYELCDIWQFDLSYYKRKSFNSYFKKFKKKYWI